MRNEQGDQTAVVVQVVRRDKNLIDNVFTVKKSLDAYVEYLKSFSSKGTDIVNCDDELVTTDRLFTDSKAYGYLTVHEEDGSKTLLSFTQRPLNRNW